MAITAWPAELGPEICSSARLDAVIQKAKAGTVSLPPELVDALDEIRSLLSVVFHATQHAFLVPSDECLIESCPVGHADEDTVSE